MKHFVLYIILIGFTCILNAQSNQTELNSTWYFKQSDKTEWLPAKVPGNVFMDLLENQLIKDPYYADQVNESRWVEKKNWEYKTTFLCEAAVLKNQHIDLIFEGLDTHASVYLNDSLILKANNMFRSWTVDVKKFIRAGQNNIKIVFESAVLYGQKEAAKLPYVLPEEERIFSRKAQFQFGWDFAPRFAGCGIWKPIKLSVWNDVKILSVHHQLNTFSDSLAKVNFIIETFCEKAGDYTFKLLDQTAQSNSEESKETLKTIKLNAGVNADTLKLNLNQPKLWWCNGLGESYLYDFQVLLTQKNNTLHTSSLSVGLRTIELVKEMDEEGVSFFFKLNGVPVFIKGANYVPNDVFLREKTKNEIQAEIDLAKNSHMNMLRVWGGGIYQDEEFFKACDKAGILVWQDLMFACAMYPGDSAFMLDVKEELKQQMIRLRSHASLALWCGNNEIDEAWHNWGWQKQFKYSPSDSAKIWKDYQNLFQTTVTELLQIYDPETPYWPSSPSIGWGHKESLIRGDSHYWGVWWGMEPFETYQKKWGRFMSEYGFQSMPALSSFKKFTAESQLQLNSSTVKAHQKHPKGYETIQTYMTQSYKVPKDFEKYIYVSQLLQRDGMQQAIETHRRNKPRCMGTLFWQMNDCWPITSWSAVDYYKQPKAFYYALTDLYKSQALSVSETDSNYVVYAYSDSIKNFGAKLSVTLMNFRSEVLWQKNYPLMMNAAKVFKVKLFKKDLPAFDPKASYLKVELFSMGKKCASRIYLNSEAKNVSLPFANVKVVLVDATTIQVSSDVFAADVYLSHEHSETFFSDNFFHLEAGQKKRITVKTKDKKLSAASIKFLVLNNL
jgi:beta-mannosidase